jgi:hypothetical protein
MPRGRLPVALVRRLDDYCPGLGAEVLTQLKNSDRFAQARIDRRKAEAERDGLSPLQWRQEPDTTGRDLVQRLARLWKRQGLEITGIRERREDDAGIFVEVVAVALGVSQQRAYEHTCAYLDLVQTMRGMGLKTQDRIFPAPKREGPRPNHPKDTDDLKLSKGEA